MHTLVFVTSPRGSMSLLYHQQPSVLLLRQKSASNADAKLHGNGSGLFSTRTHHHQRGWLSNASFKGSAPVAAAAQVTPLTSGEPDAGTTMDILSHSPDVWENYFLVYDDPCYEPVTANAEVRKEHEILKEEVRRMLTKIQITPITSDSMMPLKDRLGFIDTLQRLGVSVHFEREIANILQRVHEFDDISDSSNDLYTVSTAFRLLRDQGIYIPTTDLLDKFLSEEIAQLNQTSSTSSSNHIDGLLALYEATYCAIPGEDILDRVQELTANMLKSLLLRLGELQMSNDQQAKYEKKIQHVLHRSIRRNCDRLVARFYISMYKQEPEFGESLLKFAVHDFNIRQFGYLKELGALTRWRDETNLTKDVPLSKHRLIELHLWAMCLYTEPQYAAARVFSTKLMYMITIIDDMYDTYGTIEENRLFTEAFARLDPDASPKLQPHMKAIIRATNNIYNEFEASNRGRPYILSYLKREFERLVGSYELTTEKWIYSKIVPTYEEYFDVAMTSACRTLFPIIYFASMGEIVTEEALRLTLDDPIPRYLEASAVICRMMDDLVLSSNEVGKPHTAIPVFMKHYGVSEDKATEMINKLINDAYKEMNKAFLKSQGYKDTTIEMTRPFLKVMHGHTQANDIFNRDHDRYSFADRLKETIISIYVDPIVLP